MCRNFLKIFFDFHDISKYHQFDILTFWDFSRFFNLCSIHDQMMINANFQHFELAGSENFGILKNHPSTTSNSHLLWVTKCWKLALIIIWSWILYSRIKESAESTSKLCHQGAKRLNTRSVIMTLIMDGISPNFFVGLLRVHVMSCIFLIWWIFLSYRGRFVKNRNTAVKFPSALWLFNDWGFDVHIWWSDGREVKGVSRRRIGHICFSTLPPGGQTQKWLCL
jgi:hypothetical protein